MATKIKVIAARDFLEVTTDGIINLATSRQLFIDIAKADNLPVDYELLIDFRDTQSKLSVMDVYQLAGELIQHGSTFRRKRRIKIHIFSYCGLEQNQKYNKRDIL